MKKRWLYLIFPFMTLILELLPYGAVLNFSNPEGEPWRKTFSYFSLVPFGYANFAPFFTAVITCIILVLLVIFCITGKSRFALIARNILWVCIVFSLGQLVFGIRYLSVVGMLITLSLGAELLLFYLTTKKWKSI